MSEPRFPLVEVPRSRWEEFRRDTVKATSLALLEHVAGLAPCGRTYGLHYAHVCEVVRALHPGAATSPACLRWYVGLARDGDPLFRADLPRARPRSPEGHPLGEKARGLGRHRSRPLP